MPNPSLPPSEPAPLHLSSPNFLGGAAPVATKVHRPFHHGSCRSRSPLRSAAYSALPVAALPNAAEVCRRPPFLDFPGKCCLESFPWKVFPEMFSWKVIPKKSSLECVPWKVFPGKFSLESSDPFCGRSKFKLELWASQDSVVKNVRRIGTCQV